MIPSLPAFVYRRICETSIARMSHFEEDDGARKLVHESRNLLAIIVTWREPPPLEEEIMVATRVIQLNLDVEAWLTTAVPL